MLHQQTAKPKCSFEIPFSSYPQSVESPPPKVGRTLSMASPNALSAANLSSKRWRQALSFARRAQQQPEPSRGMRYQRIRRRGNLRRLHQHGRRVTRQNLTGDALRVKFLAELTGAFISCGVSRSARQTADMFCAAYSRSPASPPASSLAFCPGVWQRRFSSHQSVTSKSTTRFFAWCPAPSTAIITSR